jgi:hypothetical protein
MSHANYKGFSPSSINPLSIDSNNQNNNYIYNPFQNHKNETSSSRMSNSKGKIPQGYSNQNLSNTLNNQHIRSFSNCSKRDIMQSSKKSVRGLN